MERQTIQALSGKLEYIKLDPSKESQARKEIVSNHLDEVLISNQDGLHLFVAPQLSVDSKIKQGSQIDLGALKGKVLLQDRFSPLDGLFNGRNAKIAAIVGSVVLGAGAAFFYYGGHAVVTMREPGKVALSLVALAGGTMGAMSGALAVKDFQAKTNAAGDLQKLKGLALPEDIQIEESKTISESAAKVHGNQVTTSGNAVKPVSVARPALTARETEALGIAVADSLVQTVQYVASPRSHANEVRNPSVIEQIIDPRLAPTPKYAGPSVLAQIIDPKAPKTPASTEPSVLQQIISPSRNPVKKGPEQPSLIQEIFSPRSNPKPKQSGQSTASQIGQLFGAR